MSKIQAKAKNHKYLVCAIYDGLHERSTLTRIDHVVIVLASSPLSAITIAKRDHKPDGEKPTKYVASIILGPFRVNMFSNQTRTCEELLSIRAG